MGTNKKQTNKKQKIMNKTKLERATGQMANARRALISAIENACLAKGGLIEFPSDTRMKFNNGHSIATAFPQKLYNCGEGVLLAIQIVSERENPVIWQIPVRSLDNNEVFDLGGIIHGFLNTQGDASTTD